MEDRYAEVARTFGAALERLAGGYERDPESRRDLVQEIGSNRFWSASSTRTVIMANEHEPDVGQVWRRQPRAAQTMSPEEIRMKAEALDMKVKRWRQVGGLMLALLLAKTAWEVWVDTDVVERSGDTLLLIALVYVIYRFGRRALANAAPATLGRVSCVEHYRAQLVRQYESSREGWKFILPFAPGIGLIVFGRALQGRPASQVAILILFACVMFAGVLWVIARGTRKLEREIAALDGE
jgi:hypothetical protein